MAYKVRALLLVVLSLCCGRVSAQQQEPTAFDKVYEGCRLAVSALSDGAGSQSGMREAAQMLKEAEWVNFNLYAVDNAGEGKIGKHLIFSDKYFLDLANNHTVKKKAKEYAEERSGDGVRLCTKVVKGGKTVKYSFNCVGGRTLRVAAVAEVNGLVNLKVRVKKKGSAAAATERKENSDEYKGKQSRLIEMPLDSGTYIVTLEITNKGKKDCSVAIMTN